MARWFIKFIVYLTTSSLDQTIRFPGQDLTPNTKQEVIFAIIIWPPFTSDNNTSIFVIRLILKTHEWKSPCINFKGQVRRNVIQYLYKHDTSVQEHNIVLMLLFGP